MVDNMVGYLKPNFKKMNSEQKKEFKSFYCGICKALKKEYGYFALTSLNYEVTSFLILLFGLKPEKERYFYGSCTISPFVPVKYIDYFQNDVVRSASLSFLIFYYGIKDNLLDNNKLRWRIVHFFCKKNMYNHNYAYCDFDEIYDAFMTFFSNEQASDVDFEKIVKECGSLIELIFYPLILAGNYNDEITVLLTNLINNIGQWIYLIDACDDINEDSINNSFNPIFLIKNDNTLSEYINLLVKNITSIIEKVPVLSYKGIINNIFVTNIRETSEEKLKNTKKQIFHIKLLE